MPSSWTIGPLIIRSDIVLTLFSLGIGVLFLWLLGPFSKKDTKEYINQFGSLATLFLFSLLIGKAILHWDVFIQDPRAIIAYPSSTSSLYLAMGAVAVYYGWKVVVGKTLTYLVDASFAVLYVLFTGLFSFSFLELLLETSRQPEALINLGIYGVLLVSVAFQNKSILIPMSGWILSSLFFSPSFFFYSTDYRLGLGMLIYTLVIYFYIRSEKHV